MWSLKEDISEWISKTLGDVDINTDNFIYALDNGVILCRISMAIEKKAREIENRGELNEVSNLIIDTLFLIFCTFLFVLCPYSLSQC